MTTPADFDKRQQVEGFAKLVSESNRYPFGSLLRATTRPPKTLASAIVVSPRMPVPTTATFSPGTNSPVRKAWKPKGEC